MPNGNGTAMPNGNGAAAGNGAAIPRRAIETSEGDEWYSSVSDRPRTGITDVLFVAPYCPCPSGPHAKRHDLQPKQGANEGADLDAYMQPPADLQEQDVAPGLMNVALMRHQKLALFWLLRQEGKEKKDGVREDGESKDGVEKDGVEKDGVKKDGVKKDGENSNAPPLIFGGMLCDDQGLGKTVEMLALAVSNREPSRLEWESPLPTGDVYPAAEALPQGGTLVVCPTSVMEQWFEEVGARVAPAAGLSRHKYHKGGGVVRITVL